MTYAVKRNVGIVANYLDVQAANVLKASLEAKGYLVTIIPPSSVTGTTLYVPPFGYITLAKFENIEATYIVLGGQLAPEIGWLSTGILNATGNLNKLNKAGDIVIAGPVQPFLMNYNFYCVAGYTAEDTMKAVQLFAEGVTSLKAEVGAAGGAGAPFGIPGLPTEILGVKTEYWMVGGAVLLALLILTRK